MAKSILCRDAEIGEMSPVTRLIDRLLKAEGFLAESIGRIDNGGWGGDINVNRLEYLKDGTERVFITTHEPEGAKPRRPPGKERRKACLPF